MSNVIFIPGIMGSTLKMNDSKKWPVLFPQQVKELTLKNETQFFDSEPLLKYFGKKFYAVINQYLYTNYKDSYEFFSYDWRHSILNEDTFIRLRESIKGKKDITFIAHSMGGLLLFLFTKWCQENNFSEVINISKVITIATPWRGSPDALWRLYYGEPHPFANLPLTSAKVMKEVASSFPSIYQLLPRADTKLTSELVYDPNNGRSLLHSEIFEKLLNAQQFENFKTFTKSLQEKINSPWLDSIESYAVIGQNHATPKTIYLPNSNGLSSEKEKIYMGSGDLTVPVGYAIPYDVKTVCKFLKATHQNIVKNKSVLQWLSSVINGELDSKPIAFESGPSESFSGQVIKVACPVKVTIYKDEDQLIAGEANDLSELKQQIEYIESLEKEEDDDESDFLEGMKVFGETTYVISEQEAQYDYKIEGKDEGLATVEVINYNEGKIAQMNVFPSITVKQGMISTLHIEAADNISLAVNNTDKPIKPQKVFPQQSRKKLKPVTNTNFELQHGSEIMSGDNIIIQSPVQFTFTVNGIDDDEYLETRVIVNGRKFATTDKKFLLNPFPGPNEVVIYSVSIYGVVEKEPQKFNFLYDVEPPVTSYTMMLFPDKLQIYLKGEDDSKGRISTKYKVFPNRQEYDYQSSGISLSYENETQLLEYYSVDIVGHKEDIKSVVIPNESFRSKAFIAKFERYQQVIDALELTGEVEEISNNGKIVQQDDKIRKNAKSITFRLFNGNVYSLLFNQEIDVLWTIHPKEILKLDSKELDIFSFRLVSNEGFIHHDNVKVKLVPKGVRNSHTILETTFDKQSLEYQGYFGTTIIPRTVQEGKIQILVNNKIYREAKFKIM